jgi:HK97 family phage portal protein
MVMRNILAGATSELRQKMKSASLTVRGIFSPQDRSYASLATVFAGGRALSVRDYQSYIGSGFNNALMRQAFDYGDEELAMAFGVSITAATCLEVRSTILADIPLGVKDKDGNYLEKSPLDWFVNNSKRLMWLINAHLDLWGRCYLRKRRNVHGFPSQLEVIRPTDCNANIDHLTEKVVSFNVTGRAQPIPADEMVQLYLFNPISDIDGISPFEKAMRQVHTEKALKEFALAYFTNRAMPEGMLTYDGAMDDDEQRAKKAEWQQFKGAKSSFKTFFATTEGGGKWTWTPFQGNIADLAMAELTETVRADICAAFPLHPVLAGFGTAKDPLSAQSTLKELRDQHVEFIAVPRVNFITEGLNAQWVKKDFAQFGIELCAKTQEMISTTLATNERTVTATANVAAGVWTVNEAREYLGKSDNGGLIQRDPVWSLSLFNGGVITRNEARVQVGLNPLAMDGFIFDLDPRAKPQPPAPPFTFSMPGQSQITAPEPPRELSAGAENVAIESPLAKRNDTRKEPCYVILSLANNPQIVAVQNELRTQYPDIEWSDPSDFHMTLVYAESDVRLQLIKELLPKSINPYAFKVGKIDTFPSDDKTPVFLSVIPTEALTALQAGLAASFEAIGAELSAYSVPVDWHPHITLGYAPKDTPIPSGDYDFQVVGQTLICSIEGKEDFETVYITRNKERMIAALREIEQWERKVAKRGHDAPFVADYLDTEIAAWVRGNLSEGWNSVEVFRSAQRWVRDGEQPGELGATPEEYQAYWQNFDDLNADLATDWLQYMQAASEALYAAVEAGDVDGAEDVLKSWRRVMLRCKRIKPYHRPAPSRWR